MDTKKIQALEVIPYDTRWEAGDFDDEKPEARELVKILGDFDLFHNDDRFCIKTGGDEYNGEELIWMLSELINREFIKIQIHEKQNSKEIEERE